MAQNIEIKVRLRDVAGAHATAARLSGGGAERIEQRDIFFNCSKGRLKLRIFGGEHGELIHYERPDSGEARLSDYVRTPTDHASLLEQTLERALGVAGRVEKTRWLYLVGQTRVHIDEVRDLGTFLELEVVLGPEQDALAGRRIAQALMIEFGIERRDLIGRAYVDMLVSG